MKICTGISSLDNLRLIIDSEAEEFYCGVYNENWVKRFGSFSAINRRPWKNSNLSSFYELENVIKEVHLKKKKVFLTLNEHVYTNQQKPLLTEYIKKATDLSVDAIIVSDISIMQLIRNISKDIEIHVSTGGAAFNTESISFYVNNFGVTRIILPRSIKLSEIALFKKKFPNIELEIFILNEGCTYIDGFCNQLHGIRYVNENGDNLYGYSPTCQIRFDTIKAQMNEFNLDEKQLLHLINKNLHKNINCGICSLYKINKIGVDSLKLVSRSTNIVNTMSDIKRLSKAINLSKSSINEKEFLLDVKENKLVCSNFPNSKECLYSDN
ncbi:peptidase U32 family protein [Abyssisolibacter fermentans]|uniref:peptidase U32 family protein n=1 Tax=Abyssisolibacter fermentans TaxID=1766203 RepID=UPI0008356ACA|nr:U32 family peptidase [Abyssisolibacter fermentans]